MKYLLRKLGRKIRSLFRKDYVVYSGNEAEDLTTMIMSYIEEYYDENPDLMRSYIHQAINSEIKWMMLVVQARTKNGIRTLEFKDDPHRACEVIPFIDEKKI